MFALLGQEKSCIQSSPRFAPLSALCPPADPCAPLPPPLPPADYVQRFGKAEDLAGLQQGGGSKDGSSSDEDSDGFLSSSDEDEPAGKADL